MPRSHIVDVALVDHEVWLVHVPDAQGNGLRRLPSVVDPESRVRLAPERYRELIVSLSSTPHGDRSSRALAKDPAGLERWEEPGPSTVQLKLRTGRRRRRRRRPGGSLGHRRPRTRCRRVTGHGGR